MRKKLSLIIGLLLMLLLTAGIVNLSMRIWKIEATLNHLYWLVENTHSFMAHMQLEDDELPLRQEQAQLVVLLAVVVGVLVATVTVTVTDKRMRIKPYACIFLMFVLLATFTPHLLSADAKQHTSSSFTEPPHFYARVKLFVPSNPDVLYLLGLITPRPASVVCNWVCYAIGPRFPSVREWIAAGYYTTAGMGSVFYIEWCIDGVYDEKTAEGVEVVFGEKFLVDIFGGIGAWFVSILSIVDGEWKTVLEHSTCELPLASSGIAIVPAAGGETVWTQNDMSASFSGLKWATFNNLDYWDGNSCDCYTQECAPYFVNIIKPYYEFTVFGGTARYDFTISTASTGTTTPSPGTYEYRPGVDVEVTAIPDSGYFFRYWTLDGAVKFDNPITVTMDADHSLRAYFMVHGGGSDKCYPN